MRTRIVIIASLALAGCAGGMSKDECLYADWKSVGYEDGARGAPASAIAPRRQACASKAGVTLDMDAYLEGRSIGLAQYCTPSNGFSVGAQGRSYSGVCHNHEEAAFKSEYWDGAHLYKLKSVVNSAASALRSAERDLETIHYDIAFAEAALIAPDTTIVERIEFLADLKHLNEEQYRIEEAMIGLQLAHQDARRALESYEWRLASDDRSDGRAKTALAILR